MLILLKISALILSHLCHMKETTWKIKYDVWCTVTKYKVAYIQDSWSTNKSVKLEMCWYVNGSFHEFYDCSHVYQRLGTDGIFL
jgi:hypothetical protein